MQYQKAISTKVPEVMGGIVYILIPIDIFRNAEPLLMFSRRLKRRRCSKTTFGKPQEALRDGWESSLVQAERRVALCLHSSTQDPQTLLGLLGLRGPTGLSAGQKCIDRKGGGASWVRGADGVLSGAGNSPGTAVRCWGGGS